MCNMEAVLTPEQASDGLFYINYETELWRCPRCEVWVAFKDSQPCPICREEAPDPVFQWNAKQRDRRAKFTLGMQLKIGWYVIGLALGVVAVTFLLGASPLVLPTGAGFLAWAILQRAFSGGKKNES